LTRCKRVPLKAFGSASGGATLVEVVIAIVVLAFLVGSVPAAMLAVSNAHFRANQIRIAENLTRSEFEYIKSQDYNLGNVTYPLVSLDGYDVIPVDVGGFWCDVEAWPIDPETGKEIEKDLGKEPVVYKNDYGIQLITVTVYYGLAQRPDESKNLLVSTDYKVAR